MRQKTNYLIYKKRSTRKDKSKIPGVLIIFLAIVILGFSGIFTYVWLNLILVRKGYLLSAKETERKYLKEKNRELKLEVSKLKSLERIEEIAKTKLQLVEPKKNEIIWINR